MIKFRVCFPIPLNNLEVTLKYRLQKRKDLEKKTFYELRITFGTISISRTNSLIQTHE